MNIELRDRTPDHVRVYFERTQDAEIQKFFPQTVTNLQQALRNYEATRKPDASSYGRTIYVDGKYVGDVWCYGIDLTQTPQTMISYCIFDKSCWGKGIMTSALAQFLVEITNRYSISCMGAFSFCLNTASIRVLERNGFRIHDVFVEDGRESVYLQAEYCRDLTVMQ